MQRVGYTQAQSKEVAPPVIREGGHDEAIVAMPLSMTLGLEHDPHHILVVLSPSHIPP
jgi:hypothetical protein